METAENEMKENVTRKYITKETFTFFGPGDFLLTAPKNLPNGRTPSTLSLHFLQTPQALPLPDSGLPHAPKMKSD